MANSVRSTSGIANTSLPTLLNNSNFTSDTGFKIEFKDDNTGGSHLPMSATRNFLILGMAHSLGVRRAMGFARVVFSEHHSPTIPAMSGRRNEAKVCRTLHRLLD